MNDDHIATLLRSWFAADVALAAANHSLATTDPQTEDTDTVDGMYAHRNQCAAKRKAALDAAILALTSPATQGADIAVWRWRKAGGYWSKWIDYANRHVPRFILDLHEIQYAYVGAAPAASPRDGVTDANAARYLWLRDRNNSLETRQRDKGVVNGPSCYHDVGEVRELKHGEELDAAIDAAMLAAAPSPATEQAGADDEWRCFHCEEVFTTREAAAEHFGTREHHSPACQIDAAEYRRMEAMGERYAEEDADCHRAMYRMRSEHQVALRRAEEVGYARGFRGAAPVGADAVERVSALPAKWRARTAKTQAFIESTGVDTQWHKGARDGLNQAARELEAALAAATQEGGA